MSHVHRPSIVLDTNVVLDWLLFADPSSAGLASAIARRRVRWLVTAPMRGELADVLERGLAVKRLANADHVLAAFDAHAEVVADPVPPSGIAALLCTDPDDQKFLDLAQAVGAAWLVSRDRAVLKLARRAAAWRLVITEPACWIAPP